MQIRKFPIACATGAFAFSMALVPLSAETEIAGRSVSPSADPGTTLVENRKLAGSVNLDLGRHMANTAVGSITISGGSLEDSAATRIQFFENGFAEFSNGLRLTASSDALFDGPDQSFDLQIGFSGYGAYAIEQFRLPAANQYKDASGHIRNELGGSWNIEAEYGNIAGDTRIFRTGEYDSPVIGNRSWAAPADLQIGTGNPQIAPVIHVNNEPLQWEIDRGAGVTQKERLNPLIAAENIPGSKLDLSGIEISISGTALADRELTSPLISAGRVMVGSDATMINRTDLVNIRTNHDSRNLEYTHLNVDAFDREANGIHVVHSNTVDFTNNAVVSEATVSGNFLRATDSLGTHFAQMTANGVVSTLENGGAGLLGEKAQQNLSFGYTWNVVDNNSLVAKDAVIFEREGAFSDSRTYGGIGWGAVEHEHSVMTHTAIGFDARVTVDGTHKAGAHNLEVIDLNVANGRVWGEGLDGETITTETTSFQTQLIVMKDAEHSVTTSRQGVLQAGDTISVADKGRGQYQAYTSIDNVQIRGGDRLDYEIDIAGNTRIARDTPTTITVDYVGDQAELAEGDFGIVRRTNLDFVLGSYFDTDAVMPSNRTVLSSSGWWLGASLTEYSFTLETRFDAPAASSGSATLSAGSNLRQTGISLQNSADNTGSRFSTATQFEIVDSATLQEERPITASFTKIENLDPTRLGAFENNASNAASRAGFLLRPREENVDLLFSSDVISVTGLDGILHTLELSYDADLPGIHQIVWETTFDVEGASYTAWVNAILGNSNIQELDLFVGTLMVDEVTLGISEYLESTFFAGSYSGYLATVDQTPELGAWGLDSEKFTVWAVIDHNSDFAAAIPEPGTYALLFGTAGLATAGILRRRRQ